MKGKEKISFDVVVYSMMIVAVIYAIIQTMLGRNNSISFKVVLGIWILAAVILTDFIEPLVNGYFDKMTSLKMGQYIMYAVTDAAAYICMYMFVINAGYYREVSHYIMLAAGVALFVLKNYFYSRFSIKDSRQARIEEIYRTEMLEEEELRRERFQYTGAEFQKDEDDDEELKVFRSHGKK